MITIQTDKAPAAIGPYSQAIGAGDYLFCSGQLGIDPATKALAGATIELQAAQVFKNIKAVLNEASLDMENVVKTTVFLADLKHFPVVNELYAKQFRGHKPARSTVQVARLPMDALIEIECIALFEE